MCAECRDKLHDQESCPQCCRPGLAKTQLDVLIMGSRPKVNVPSLPGLPFHFRTSKHRRLGRGNLYIRVGTERGTSRDAYARVEKRQTTTDLVFILMETQRDERGRSRSQQVDSKTQLLECVTLALWLQHLDWTAIIELLVFGLEKGSRPYRRDHDARKRLKSTIKPAQGQKTEMSRNTLEGSAENPVTL